MVRLNKATRASLAPACAGKKVGASAVEALDEASDVYLETVFSLALDAAQHAGRTKVRFFLNLYEMRIVRRAPPAPGPLKMNRAYVFCRIFTECSQMSANP